MLKHVLFFLKKFLQEKNGIFDMGVPILGGVCPRGNFSHIMPFFSEDVPKLVLKCLEPTISICITCNHPLPWDGRQGKPQRSLDEAQAYWPPEVPFKWVSQSLLSHLVPGGPGVKHSSTVVPLHYDASPIENGKLRNLPKWLPHPPFLEDMNCFRLNIWTQHLVSFTFWHIFGTSWSFREGKHFW